MDLKIPVKEMITTEKLRTMEMLWDDLCQNPDEIPSPPWHREVLLNRETKVKEGLDYFTDWNEAKKSIRKSVS